MSDKSKLGFNINPKSYDELNSTDNLITSGSDSGWLGKKLQGDNNNTIDLSKINPLFDKELYEKYRPGINTNDGSVNQDIWGYKCFNSPVSFRNGIYGDTYSITENKSNSESILVLRTAHGNYEGRISIAGSSMTMTTGQDAKSDPYIEINGDDNSITLHAGKLNLPSTIETTAKFANKACALSKEINSANYIYATDNSILPNNDDVISLGSNSSKYSNIYADRLIGTALAAQGITYRNILDGTYTDLLITTSANKIVPYDNRKIDIGSTLAPLQNIYADKFIGTVTKAERDSNNNIITDTYFKLDSNNRITGLNYIKGAGERIRFTEADTGSVRTFTSIATSYADNYHEYCTNLRWSNNDETAFIVCGLKLKISYDPNSDSGEFQILPHVYTDSTSSDITMSMVLGSKDEPLSRVYCKNFPTITGEQNTTSVGNIRLLAIQSPYMPNTDIYQTIGHGSEIQSPIMIDGKDFNIYIARLHAAVVNGDNIIKLMIDVDSGVVAGKWRLLSSVAITNSKTAEMYTPVLAMRVE